MPLSPLRFSDLKFYGYSEEFIARQAARPDSWRDQWPDDPCLTEIRDHLSPLLRRQYGFKTDAFLPDDGMMAIMAMGDEAVDPVETIMLVEEFFDIKITDEMMREIQRDDTYLNFVTLVLNLAGPDYGAGIDAKFLQPLCLPTEYHQAGRSTFWRRLPVIGGDNRWHRALRKRQTERLANSPRWVKRWPEDLGLISLRDEASRLMANRLDWPNLAFLPDDQLAALFHHKRGRECIPAVLADLNRTFGTDLDVDFIVSSGRTYLDLLRHIQITRTK